MISRKIADSIKKSPKSVLLLGPRQVGKSTLIQSLTPDMTINLSDDKTYLDFKSNPNELRERLLADPSKTVFIDEIQRHPPLLNTIQAILDAQSPKNKMKFYLTGSSARKLKRGQANLLPGRIFSYELGPLCAAELDYKLATNRALKYGCLPEAYLADRNDFAEKLLSTYSAVYLKEEIQAEALTRNLEGFSRFILTAAEASAQIMDFSKLAKQAKIERKNCTRFYEILEDTMIGLRLDVYEKTSADITKRPKFYFFDVGVLNGLLGNFTVSADRKGALFETLVISQIQASAKAFDKQIKLSYFRTRAGLEVDLIVEIDRKSYAIEIKSGQAREADTKSLERFKTDYAKGFDGFFAITTDEVSRQIGDVRIVGLSTFLKSIGL